MNKCNNGPDLSALPFIYNKIQDNKITALFNGWSTDLRYFYGDKVRVKDIDQELLSKYLKYVEEFLTLILRRF
ncbi:hypothetical protein [Pedobacter quisquiliarum]|nr:hypothetical protein [Pedobacter quisquiliarum]